jgi:hypothetical protein
VKMKSSQVTNAHAAGVCNNLTTLFMLKVKGKVFNILRVAP